MIDSLGLGTARHVLVLDTPPGWIWEHKGVRRSRALALVFTVSSFLIFFGGEGGWRERRGRRGMRRESEDAGVGEPIPSPFPQHVRRIVSRWSWDRYR